VNDRYVDLSDITPAILGDYMALGEDVIETQLYEMKKENRKLNDTVSRPSVLLGRMAVLGDEFSVFTERGMEVIDDDDLTREDLKKKYRGFWLEIEETNYVPEIHRNIMLFNRTLGGTWLGVRKNDS